MLHQPYEYILELYKREPKRLLGRAPVALDATPLGEALLLDLVRRGELADFANPPAVRVEPQYDESWVQEPILGLLVSADLADKRRASFTVSIDYFGDAAQQAADKFIETGDLESGELFEYRIFARKREPSPAAPKKRFSLEPNAPSVPITPSSLQSQMDSALLLGDWAKRDIPVFVDWSVLSEASDLTRQAGALETGGVLIGHMHRDSAEVFLEITAQIPAAARSQLTRLSFGPDTWSQVQAAVDARKQREVWLGWWHSHSYFKDKKSNGSPDHATKAQRALPFLSSEDRLLHRTVFPRAYSVALLITDSPQSGMSWALFGWRAGLIVQRGFHVIHAPIRGAGFQPVPDDRRTAVPAVSAVKDRLEAYPTPTRRTAVPAVSDVKDRLEACSTDGKDRPQSLPMKDGGTHYATS